MREIFISPTRLNQAERCAYQMHLVDTIGPRPPGWVLVQGRTAHRSRARVLTHKVEHGGELPPEDQVREETRDDIAMVFTSEEIDWSGHDHEDRPDIAQGEVIDYSVKLATVDLQSFLPRLMALDEGWIERRVSVDLQGYPYPLKGYVDCLSDGRVITDLKHTGRRSIPETDAVDSQQMMFYDLLLRAVGEPTEGQELQYLWNHRGSIEPVSRHAPTRTEEELQMLLKRIEAVSKMLEADVYPPSSPDNWWCSKKFCGFWDQCPYAHKMHRPKS